MSVTESFMLVYFHEEIYICILSSKRHKQLIQRWHEISLSVLTPDKSTPENTVFQSEISRACHGKGEATEYSESAGSRQDRQSIQ